MAQGNGKFFTTLRRVTSNSKIDQVVLRVLDLACVGKRESVNVEFPGKKQQNEWKTGNFERKQERKYLHSWQFSVPDARPSSGITFLWTVEYVLKRINPFFSMF